jgi:hypothetical protein
MLNDAQKTSCQLFCLSRPRSRVAVFDLQLLCMPKRFPWLFGLAERMVMHQMLLMHQKRFCLMREV